MATSQEYAAWLRSNQNKQGTPDYQTVLRAFQEARLEELSAQAAPAAPQAQPQSGMGPAFRAGIEGLMGAGAALAGRTGLMDMAEAEKAVEERRKRAAEIYKPTEEWGLTKLGELLAGSAPYMAAPLAAAGAAAALPLTGTAATVAALGATGLASATQFTGTNLSRQLEEGKKLADTDLGAAALAAAPMALLDTLSMRMLPGVGRLLGDAGIKVTKETAKEVSEQILKKAALDYTAATGKAMGAEGLTEAAQQGFERLQAGLNLTDADARKEYFDSLIGGALLGGTIAPAGRFLERGKAKREVAAIERDAAQEQAQAAREAEEAQKQQPEYVEGLHSTYQDLLAQKKTLEAQIKKGSKEAPLSQEDKDANEVINRQLAELKRPLGEAKRAFIDAGGPQALAAARARQLQPTPVETPGTDEELEAQRRERLLDELDRAQLLGDTERVSALQRQLEPSAPETPEAQSARLTRDTTTLEALLERQREQIKSAATPEDAAEIAARAQQTYDALTQAKAQLEKLPQAPTVAALKEQETALLKQFEDARESGDQQAVLNVVPKLQEVRRQLQEAQPFDLTSEEYVAAQEKADRSVGLRTQLEQEGKAERKAMSEFAALRAAITGAREVRERQEAMEVAPQLDMFPAPRERITRTEVQQAPQERPAEVAPLRAELARLLRERRELERQAVEAPPAPGAELAGPATLLPADNAQERIRAINTRIAEVEDRLTGLTAPGVETRTVGGLPETARPLSQPASPLQARLNTLAERVLGSQRVDEGTKALVREVQDNLPALLERDPVAQRTLGRRGSIQQGLADAGSVGAWLYRTLQGTAPADLTQDIRARLDELAAGRRSETEQATQYAQRALTAEEKQQLRGTSLAGRQGVMTRMPTGEVRRAVQTELEMPEAVATAFEDFEAFQKYLASEGLQELRAASKDVKDGAIPNAYRTNVIVSALNKQADELQARLKTLVQQRREALRQPEADVQTAKTLAQEADAALKRALRDVGPGGIFVAMFEGRLQERIQRTKAAVAAAEKVKADLLARFQANIDTLNNALAEHSRALEAVRTAPATASAEGVEPATVMLRYEAAAVQKRADVEAAASRSRDALQALLNNLKQTQAKRKEAQAALDAVNAVTDSAEYATKQKENASKILSLPTLLKEERRLRNDIGIENARFLKLAQQSLSTSPFKAPVLRDRVFKDFLVEEARLTDLLNEQDKRLSQLNATLSSARTKLNGIYTVAEELGGKELQALRNRVLSANQLLRESQQTLMAAREAAYTPEKAAEAAELGKQFRNLRTQAQTLERGAAARAAAQRAAPAMETQSEREARDSEERRAEQAQLERLEALPGTRIEFVRGSTRDTTLDSLIVKAEMAKTREEREEVKKETQAYLDARINNLNNNLKEMARKAAVNLENQKKQREAIARLRERLEKNATEKGRTMTPRQRETAERKLAEAERLLAEHARRYTQNTREMKVVRTDIQAERAAKKARLSDVMSRFEPGQRLGEAEGTQMRATGPVTRDEVMPPRGMLTGSEESRAGKTTTPARMRYSTAKQDVVGERTTQEARGVAQRDIAMTRKEQAEANRIAAELAKQTPEQKAAAAKEEAEVQKEQAKLRSAAEEKALKEPTRKAKAVEEIEEDLYEAPEIELLGGPEEDVFYREAGPQYETRDLTDLTPAALEAVEDGDIRTALADLEKNGSTPFVRELAKHLGDMTMRTKLEVQDIVEDNGVQVEGVYNSSKNLVRLHRSALSEETLTHELTHAATMRALEADPETLTPTQRAARKEIESMHAAIQKQPDFAREYGRKDVKEFVSELMSNLDFRNKLDAQKPNFIRRIYDAFMRLIGFPRATMSEKAVKAAYKLFMPAQALKAAPAASAKRGVAGLATANRVADSLIAKQTSWLDKVKANLRAGRAQYIDKLAPVEQALKKGEVEERKANQALYNLRMYDQRMHFTAQALSDGAPGLVEKTRRDGRTERLIEAIPGANLNQIVSILKAKDVVKEAGSPDAANRLFTLYLAAIRGERVGYDTLNLKASAADIKAAKAEIDANPTLKNAFDEARDIYNQYNRNLMKFAMDTGAIGKDLGNRLLASNDYIPYYRMRNGVAELMIGKETPVRIGNLKDSPHLQELVGGDEAIFDFLTSSVQNTSMLIDMSMKNLATKNLMYELRDVGLAKIAKVKGGNAPTGSVTFKRDGEEYFAIVDTDALGVDSELLVKGLAGIPTMFPQMIRVLGMPARLLRRLVVASPVYMARQLVRDSAQAAIASGANMVPVLGSLKQIGKPSVLERRGITGGMVFTGMPEDQTRLLKEMQAGKIGLSSGLARLEAVSAKLDALTREAQYESYREQGLSEMEATLAALESMNFSRRGLSPTMHMLSTVLPFFNAQIQGLDVLYRSFRGDMPFNEQLEIRKKLLVRGAMLFGMSMIYAAMMQDDEAYKNAKPEDKYSNFFLHVPGTDEPLRLPIPFELGYIFKALPEALVNIMANEKGGEEAFKALKFIAKQTVPGLSSYFMPQAVKPALEVAFGKSAYTDRDIESAQEKGVEAGYRYRETTTELAKEIGELTGLSPIKLEYLIRGYTGSMGMALVQAVSAPFGRTGPEAATKRPSDLPVVGTLFQPTDASGIIDAVYERMNKALEIQETYKSLAQKGRPEAAQAYLNRNLDSFVLAPLAGSFKQQMGEITQYERAVRASSMTADQKREALDRARQAKINLAKAVQAASDRTARQAVPA